MYSGLLKGALKLLSSNKPHSLSLKSCSRHFPLGTRGFDTREVMDANRKNIIGDFNHNIREKHEAEY